MSAGTSSFHTDSQPAAAIRWRWLLLPLALLVGILDLWAASTSMTRTTVSGRAGTLYAAFDHAQAGGWQRITRMADRSPLRQLGADVGDFVRFARRGEPWLRTWGTDEQVNLELRSTSGVRAVTVVPSPRPPPTPWRALQDVSSRLASLLAIAIGALLAWHRSGSSAIRGLAAFLILNGATMDWYDLPSGALREQVVMWLQPVLSDIGLLGGVWFAFHIGDERSLASKRAAMAVLIASSALLLTSLPRWTLQWLIGFDARIWTASSVVDWFTGFDGYFLVWLIVNATTAIVIGAHWLRSSGARRLRIGWIGLALALPPLWVAIAQLLPSTQSAAAAAFSLASPYVSLCGSMVLGWAVLWRRMFGFGLVAQRALAYSLVTSLVIGVLALAKFATEHMLERMGGDGSGVVQNVLIIIVVVVAFAVLQPHATRHVTRLFFRHWHLAAERLRTFVDDVAQLDDGEEIKRQLVEAVDVFTDRAGCALYIADAEGRLRLFAATLSQSPAALEPETEITLNLAADSRPVDLSRCERRFPGDWMFGMKSRGRLFGALLIGAREEGIAYRPEEISQLANSVRTVGLHLIGLRAAELEQERDEMVRKLTEAEAAVPVPARDASPSASSP